jgi:hypothetical protein
LHGGSVSLGAEPIPHIALKRVATGETMNSDPVIHADDHFGAVNAYHARVGQAEAAYVAQIIAACQKGDANALALFAPPTIDWEAQHKRPLVFDGSAPKRTQTLTEVLAGCLVERGPGPSMAQVMQLVMSLAYSAQPQAVMAQQARALLAEMARQAASNDVTVDD